MSQGIEGACSQSQHTEGEIIITRANNGDSKLLTHIYTVSHLVSFAFLGTLARLGIQSLTTYVNAPIVFPSLWYNFAGCYVMSFLFEDCTFFSYGHQTLLYHQKVKEIRQSALAHEADYERINSDSEAAKRTYQIEKKSTPLYIGLTTGFCGSLTSFSSFIRDTFLALVNLLPLRHDLDDIEKTRLLSITPADSRSISYCLMASIAIIITTVSLCISAWILGLNVADILNLSKSSSIVKFNSRILNRAMAYFALASWLVIMTLLVYHYVKPVEDVTNSYNTLLFSLAIAPLGCLCRYYFSLLLNNKFATFPVGTFMANVLATIILGISFDLQRIPVGFIVGCQMFQGVQDGFCGCLSTVSSWISELYLLERKHAYFYGVTSVIVSLCLLILINGSLLWTRGFTEPFCVN